MTKLVIPKKIQTSLRKFLKSSRKPELIPSYLFYVGQCYNISPIAVPVEKTIFESEEKAIKLLEEEGKLWKETEIKIRFGERNVNEDTKKIYICPFTGKVFGDNTHPNPQDAIYDWVSSCPENTERSGGLKVKRFYVSEDPQVIKNYIKERKKTISKTVFSSAINGKLFNSKEAVIQDFQANYVKVISLVEVQNQNRFEIEDTFLDFLQNHLDETKISTFVENLAEIEDFVPYVEAWLSESEEANDED
jgi:hypothetical protein